MANYIDILLTANGKFCVAPPWVVKVGDLVCLPNMVSGRDELVEVISVSTDATDGDQMKMLERYVGNPLPRISAKYFKDEIQWEESNVSE